MDMLNKWIYVVSLFQLLWTFKEVQSYVDYCYGYTPVVKICQDSSVEDQSVVYVNSGGAPKLQVIKCKCDIIKPNDRSLQFTLENGNNMKDDITFSIDESELHHQLTGSGTLRLFYSKTNDTTDGGGCVKIEDIEGEKFSVNCEAKGKADTGETLNEETNGEKTNTEETETGDTEALAGDPDTENDNIIAAAIGGAVGFIALVVCVAVCIVLGRKRKASSNAGSANNTKDYEDPTNNYGLQPNPAYEGFEPDKENKNENDYEEQYAIPDAPQRGDMHKTTEYDYTDFKPSAASTSPTIQQSTPNSTDNTYDHTVTISTDKTGVTENEYNHLPLSVSQNANNDDYNTLGDIHVQPKRQNVESDYNVLSHP